MKKEYLIKQNRVKVVIENENCITLIANPSEAVKNRDWAIQYINNPSEAI